MIFNTAPQLIANQVIAVNNNSLSSKISLEKGTDLENDVLTYSIVNPPSQGTLSNCLGLGGVKGLNCLYTPLENFTGEIKFSYKSSDDSLDSPPSIITLRITSFSEFITQIVLGYRNSCAIFNEGNIRCWGKNNGGSLGFGHSQPIGDNETPLSLGNVDVGGKVLRLALSRTFTCALLKNKKVKCWGGNNSGVLGLGHNSYTSNLKPSSLGTINFGTQAFVKDINAGGSHVCALFETGKIKCWGRNNYGQLGYGHTQDIGDAETLDEVDFVDLGARAIGISLGENHSCALLIGGQVKCWGQNNYGQLGLSHKNNIGDNELLSSMASIRLGGQAVEISSGNGFFLCKIQHRSCEVLGKRL